MDTGSRTQPFPVKFPAPATLAPVDIGQVLRGAAVFDFKRHRDRESFMNANNIIVEAEELFDLLEARGVPFLLVGGLAMLAHVEGRNTDHVDLIISVPDQQRLEPEVKLADPGSPFAMGTYKQFRVDYLDAGVSLYKVMAEQHGEARRFNFLRGGRLLRCATPRGLMLLKLFALPDVLRKFDWRRVDAYESDVLMLWLAHPELDPHDLLAVLRPFVDEAALYSLANEVLPDLARRRERYARPGSSRPPG